MVLEGPASLLLRLQFSLQHRGLPKHSRGAHKPHSVLLSNETSRPITKLKAPEMASHQALSTGLARDRLEAAVPAFPAAAVNFPRGTWHHQRVPGDPGRKRDTEMDDPKPRDGEGPSTARTGNDMGSRRDKIKPGPKSSILSSKI